MFDQLGQGVYRRRYESLDLNIGVVLGEDGVLLVDTRASHVQADELITELGELTDLPVRWVVNTHWHWDHTFGNARFPGAEIWGHERVRSRLLEEGDEMRVSGRAWLPPSRHHEIDEVEITPPTHTMTDRVSLSIGREVRLSHHGLGHSDGDILIVVPDADVTYLGDLVEEGAPPAFNDSYPIDWPLTLRLGLEVATGVMVPGHGDVVDLPFVITQHEELVAVAELATRVIEGDMAEADALRAGPYPPEVMSVAIQRALAAGRSVE